MPFTRLRQSMIKPNGSITGSLSGTSSYSRRTLTASYALNSSGGGGGGSVQTGSIAKQTVWTNVTSGSTNTITSLNLSSNKWDVSVVEEWDAATLDQYYNSSSLLCHFNGADGSTTITDNSKNNLTVTATNGAAISTAQSKFGGASVFLDGTNDYVSVTNSTDFDFGAGDFTIEYWEYRTVSTNNKPVLSRNNSQYPPYLIGWSDTGSVYFYSSDNGSSWNVASGVSMGSIITNSWTHYAVTRQGNTFRTFQNGSTQISTFTSTATFPAGAGALSIGAWLWATGYFFQGYIDELRITKGVARYTSNFTPQKYEFPNSRNQVLTRYVGLVGGVDDKYVDYGVEKLSNSSLKLTRLTYPNQPLIGSGSLSGSVSRVYVNVLDYTNVSVTSSYATNALNSINSLDIPKIKSIIYTNSGYTPTTASAVDLVKGNKYIIISGSNFKSSASVFIDATTGSIVSYVNTNRLNVNVATKTVGTYPIYLMNTDGASTFKINAITYIAGTTTTTKAIFGYGYIPGDVSMTNLVSNTGVVATDTTGVGTARAVPSAAGYGTDKAIFGYGINGNPGSVVSMTNLVSNTGVVATDTTGVGTARRDSAAAGYGTDKAIFGYGSINNVGYYMTNLVSNTGVVATDTTGVGTVRWALAATGYGTDKAIFGYGYTGAYVSMTNLVSNTGTVAIDTTGVGTSRYYLGAARYGTDKAIFGYGNNGGTLSVTNLVSNTGVVATDTTGVGTARYFAAAAGYGSDKAIFGYGYTSTNVSMTNLVSNTGTVATDTAGVGTARHSVAAAGYSTT